MSDIVWRGMTRGQLDAAYNNSAAVANSAAQLAEWSERSARLRERHPGALDLRYGPREFTPLPGSEHRRCPATWGHP